MGTDLPEQVDKQELISKLQQREVLLGRLFLSDQIEPDSYYKQLLVLACDFQSAGETLHASLLAERIYVSYIDDTLPGQLEEDPAFGEMLYTLCRAFIDEEVVSLVPAYTTFAPPAQA